MKTLLKTDNAPSSVLLSLLPMLGIWVGTPVLAQPLPNTVIPSQAYAYPYDPPNHLQESVEVAIAATQERIRRNPSDGLDRTSLAHSYLKLARITGEERWYQRAEAEAKQSLANLPFSNDGALLALAKVAESNHDFAAALHWAEQASGEEAIAIRVTAKLAMGQVKSASGLAEELVNATPSLGSLTLRAITQSARGNHEAALKDFQQAIAVEEPTEVRGSALVRSLLGKRYFNQGQYALAEQLYRVALTIVPDYPQALLALAELQTRQGDYPAAEETYSQVDDPLALLGIARVKALQGKVAQAHDVWQKVESILRQKIAQNPLDHRRELAQLLLERQNPADIAEAITLMTAEVAHRKDAPTLETFAWALSRSGRWQEAQRVIGEALDQGIQEASIFYRAGIIETALQNPSQATRYFQLADKLDPAFGQQVPQQLKLKGLSSLSSHIFRVSCKPPQRR